MKLIPALLLLALGIFVAWSAIATLRRDLTVYAKCTRKVKARCIGFLDPEFEQDGKQHPVQGSIMEIEFEDEIKQIAITENSTTQKVAIDQEITVYCSFDDTPIVVFDTKAGFIRSMLGMILFGVALLALGALIFVVQVSKWAI